MNYIQRKFCYRIARCSRQMSTLMKNVRNDCSNTFAKGEFPNPNIRSVLKAESGRGPS